MKIKIILVALFAPLLGWTQHINNKVINAGGGTNSAVHLTFSIAEPVTRSRIVSGQIFSQGFIQSSKQTITGLNLESNVSNIIFPNPAVNRFYINTSFECSIELTDQTGKRLIAAKPTKDGIDVSALAQGVYIVYIFDATGNKITVEKLLKY